jgi:DNA-binding PadR family transcriptional regulator
MTTQTLAVLSVMLSDPRLEWYGLELCRMARIQPGTVYPILDRLLKAQWVTRHWEDIDPSAEGRPRRRLYTLTPHGAVAAQEARDRHLRDLQAPARLAWKPTGVRAR